VGALFVNTVIGSLAAGGVLVMLGWVARDTFWEEFRGSLKIATFISIVAGITIGTYEGFRWRLEGATLSVRKEEASFACNRCSATFGMAEVKHQLDDVADNLKIIEPDSQELPLHFLPRLYSAFIKCPECGSSDAHLDKGGDIRVEKLVME
jgi:Zn finger protein HypA/HybF involved in hydrogenase expression